MTADKKIDNVKPYMIGSMIMDFIGCFVLFIGDFIRVYYAYDSDFSSLFDPQEILFEVFTYLIGILLLIDILLCAKWLRNPSTDKLTIIFIMIIMQSILFGLSLVAFGYIMNIYISTWHAGIGFIGSGVSAIASLIFYDMMINEIKKTAWLNRSTSN
ncbi:MAG: hypothetical protein ACFFAS_14850 [Promethearchaeota archaeon]